MFKRRLLLTILALILALTLTSVGIFADDSYAGDGQDAGNVSWSLDDGVLTISGEGDMDDYYMTSSGPWSEYTQDIKKIVIKPGITSIGTCAFMNCTGLTSVDIPDSVTAIRMKAFEGCSSLTGSDLPKSITKIEGLAFRECTKLTSFRFPEGMDTISGHIFEGCSSLESVTIPDSVTSIGMRAFYGCSLLKDVTLPDKLTLIDHQAFYNCKSLTRLEIPESVEEMGLDSFRHADDLILIVSSAYAEQYVRSRNYRYDLASGHQPDSGTITIRPSCSKPGQMTYTCTTCKSVIEEKEIPATGNHRFGSWKTVKKPTYAKKGSKVRECTKCHLTEKASVPKLKVKATAITKVSAARKGFTVKWKKGSGINGYEIQYARNSKFTKSRKTVKVKKPGTVSRKITKLKPKTKYYVRIRAYKTVSGKKYCSKWSKPKAVRTKK